MNNEKITIRRVIIYLVGLFIMTVGVAISVKSNLGVSPVSSIPYTVTCVAGIEMGNATILFHAFLVLLQLCLLRDKFRWINLLQILVGVIFGKFTTLSNSLAAMFPTPENMVVRILMLVISIVLIAIGIFFYMPANVMPLAGEGAMQAVSDVIHVEFPKVKIGFDITMVVISLITCMITLGNPGSVGIGTVLAAVFVGVVLGWISRRFGSWRDSILYPDVMPETTLS